jgi:hypothetical protein
MIVATAKAPTGTFLSGMGPAPLAILGVAILVIFLSGVSLRASRRELEAQATTDSLTGLGNRRKLMVDLARAVRTSRAEEATVLTLFDLNGFKNYNDAFGHPAGDALLLRLETNLAPAVGRVPARRRRVLPHRPGRRPSRRRAGRVRGALGVGRGLRRHHRLRHRRHPAGHGRRQ